MTSFTVCIPAAGAGTRMHSSVPKQYLPLCGRPVLLHTLDVFEAMAGCTHIVIATDDRETLLPMLATAELSTQVTVVQGGALRQDSVAHALAAVVDVDTVVLVHDAARPCVRAEDVQAVADAVAEYGAALLAVPARDTLKEVRGGLVQGTIDRSVVWQAQTPQGARAGLFRRAFAQLRARGQVTDDVALIEALGEPVHVVQGSAGNIKITAPEDVPLAEAVLRAAGRGNCE
ncbi:MAG: 2-C-methyl-D-erythritol 4-phosphate cytidylyltransferase [Bacteroidota bacterium]|nr:2-C-methyl-D-erythritol 4-phosphate cytidylyltransferase [Bacteroidota bacterium]